MGDETESIGKVKRKAERAKRDAPDDLDGNEPKAALPATVPQLSLVALLVGVLVYYRDADAWKLVAALTAVSIAIVVFRFGNLKKVTSKLISFEMQPVVQRANAATSRANKAAQEAKQVAGEASAVAMRAQTEVELASATIDKLRALSAELAVIAAIGYAKRMGGPTERARLHTARELEKLLRELGCTDAQLQRPMEYLFRTIRRDLAQNVLMLASYDGELRGTPELRETVQEHRRELEATRRRERRNVTPDDLRALLDLAEFPPDHKARRALRGFEHFIEQKELLGADGSDSGE